MNDSSEEVAIALFHAIETGKSWEDCRRYCDSEVIFYSKAEPPGELLTLEYYMRWRPNFLAKFAVTKPTIDALCISADEETVTIFATFQAAHPDEPRPVPWRGESDLVQYVYIMWFSCSIVSVIYKVWNPGWMYKHLGLPLPD